MAATVAAWLVWDLWSAAAPTPIIDDFLRLLEDSFARVWRKPRTWPACSDSPPARAPTVLVETSQQFRVTQ